MKRGREGVCNVHEGSTRSVNLSLELGGRGEKQFWIGGGVNKLVSLFGGSEKQV